MRLTIFSWLEHEFVRVYGEGRPGLPVAEATRDLLGRMGADLATQGLSLDDVVRTRLFARDRAGRDAGAGVYWLKLSAGALAETRRVVRLR